MSQAAPIAPSPDLDAARLSELEWLPAIRQARRELRAMYGLASGIEGSLPTVAFDKVNVTVRREGRVRASMSGRGSSLAEAIASAVRKCAADDRFDGPVAADEVEACVLELWIQLESEPLGDRTPEALARDLIPGIHGVEIRLDRAYAYYKPSVPLTSELADPSELLDRLCAKAGLPPGTWREAAADLRRTHWVHVVEEERAESGCRILRRLRDPRAPSLDSASILESACAAGRRLVAGQDSDSCFLYRYDPIKDQAQAGRFSSVRHAGCAYALAWLGDRLGETAGGEFTWAATRALGKLLRQSLPMQGVEDALYVSEGRSRQGRLGCSALTLLAMQFAPLDDLFAASRDGLVNTLLALQTPQGWFEPSIARDLPQETGQDYYPGEALTALGRELHRSGDDRIRSAFSTAFPYYRDYFRARPSTAFILWQADAWRLFAETAPTTSPYAEFVYEMVDWLLPLQYTTEDADRVGGFPRPSTPRYSTACYVEAIVRACGLALRRGEMDRAARYREAARAGLAFVRRLQAGPETAFLFPRPECAVGGITANLSTFAMRSDFDQHAITAFLAALEVSLEFPRHAILYD